MKTIRIIALSFVRRAILTYLILQSFLFYLALLVSIVFSPYQSEHLARNYSATLFTILLFFLSVTSSLILYRGFKAKSITGGKRSLYTASAFALVVSYIIQICSIDYSGKLPFLLLCLYIVVISIGLFVFAMTLSIQLYSSVFSDKLMLNPSNGSENEASRLALLILQIVFVCVLIILTCSSLFLTLIGYF